MKGQMKKNGGNDHNADRNGNQNILGSIIVAFQTVQGCGCCGRRGRRSCCGCGGCCCCRNANFLNKHFAPNQKFEI